MGDHTIREPSKRHTDNKALEASSRRDIDQTGCLLPHTIGCRCDPRTPTVYTRPESTPLFPSQAWPTSTPTNRCHSTHSHIRRRSPVPPPFRIITRSRPPDPIL
ncbi:hypothetical protein BC826DRAFT_979842 [Russula brevipes]|nr:hypothetical protein BC826DRAFT_979842 [Russula brevipes]